MTHELHLRIAGAMQIALALLHLHFPRRFRWREELARLSLLNRRIFQVHTLFVCFVLLLFGAVSLCAPDALLEPTRLAGLVLGGIAGFWALRLWCQWFVYDRQLWRGQRLPTAVHWAFTGVWIYFTAVYTAAMLSVIDA